MNARITVAVCTRDRAVSLARTLDSMTTLEVPADLDWELLVVDNGSADDTHRVIASFARRLPLRGIEEERGGLAYARNRAVDVASGDYLLWTDDDATVDAGWLRAYSAAFRRWPEAAVFGGRVDAQFEGTPPAWLLRALWRVPGAFALRDLGSEPAPLATGTGLPYGANFGIRADEQRRYRYDPSLGRRPGGRIVSGEETDVISRVLEAGGKGWWVPDARVVHHISRERQTVRYLRRFYEGCGEGVGRAEARAGAEASGGRAEARARLVGRALIAEVRYRAARLVQPPERWIVALVAAAMALGRCRGSR